MIEQRIVFKCDVCGHEESVELDVHTLQAVITPAQPPPGWSLVATSPDISPQRLLVCHKHKVTIEDKRK